MSEIINSPERRREAILAMEGEKHRERRERTEATTRLAESAARTAAEEQARQEAISAAKLARERATQAAAEEAALAAAGDRQNQNREARATTERLKTSSPGLSSLRTIKTDMARAVKEEGLSLSKIVTASGRSGEVRDLTSARSSRALVALALVLVLAAGGGLFYWWWQARRTVPPTTVASAPAAGKTILSTDRDEGLDTSNWNSVNQARAAVGTAAASANALVGLNNIYFYQTTGGPVTFTRLATRLGLTVPDDLARHLRDTYLFGFYYSGEIRSRLLLLQTSFFDQAWAAMFAWERYLPTDLGPLLDIPAGKQITWSDKIIKNKDVRVATDAAGNTLVVYGFLDEQNILIARNEITFTKVFERLLNES